MRESRQALKIISLLPNAGADISFLRPACRP